MGDAFFAFSKDPLNLEDRPVNLWINMVPGLRPDDDENRYQ